MKDITTIKGIDYIECNELITRYTSENKLDRKIAKFKGISYGIKEVVANSFVLIKVLIPLDNVEEYSNYVEPKAPRKEYLIVNYIKTLLNI